MSLLLGGVGPRRSSRGAAGFFLLFLFGCVHTPPASKGAGGGSPSVTKSPLSEAELRTTDGEIAVANLQAQIEGEEKLAAHRPLTVVQRAGIAGLVAMRGQFLGRIADYERAAEMAEALVLEMPNDPEAFLARAEARASLHRFTAALADLDEAERLGLRSGRLGSMRAAIFEATGRYDEALALRLPVARTRPDIRSLGALASLRAARGEVEEAERLFAEAPLHYRDVSPFPMAWLYFQQGSMWMREGKLERARELFEASQRRLPAYATARGHLGEVEAALGRTERAVALLRPLAQSSDDPDYAAQLARILSDAAQPEEAASWRAIAATRYDDLVRRHPEAFADHAAEFWLAAGGEPRRALRLAQTNLDVRPTPRAYELVMQAALAVGDQKVACAAAARASALPHPWPSLRSVTAQALAGCGG